MRRSRAGCGSSASRAPPLDGTTSETFVLAPAPAAPATLQLHGGPHSSSPSAAGIQALLPLLAAGAGIATVMPNPRGGDADDVLTALAAAAGLCDARAPTVSGWSYGAYLAAWLLVTTPRFVAGVVGSALTDLERFAATTDASGYLEHEVGSDPTRLRDHSPYHRITMAPAPVLLLHGTHDLRCPIEQSRRSLRRSGAKAATPNWSNTRPRRIPPRAARTSQTCSLARSLAWLTAAANYNGADGQQSSPQRGSRNNDP